MKKSTLKRFSLIGGSKDSTTTKGSSSDSSIKNESKTTKEKATRAKKGSFTYLLKIKTHMGCMGTCHCLLDSFCHFSGWHPK